MKLYRINKDGFQIGQALGKKAAVNHLEKELAWEGIVGATWGKFKAGCLKVTTSHHEFTIEEGVVL